MVDDVECFSRVRSWRVEETDRPSRDVEEWLAPPFGVICSEELSSSSSIPFVGLSVAPDDRLFSVTVICFRGGEDSLATAADVETNEG